MLVGSSLLVPLGISLLNSGLRKDLSVFYTGPVAWDFIFGILFSAAPIVILLALQIINREENNEEDPWALLFFKSVADTRTETIEEPNPTSVEFEKIFSDLMDNALTDENRKIVIVLDNLDRIDGSDALSILSTLQTFFQHRQQLKLDWLSRLWVIIPYDRDSLQRLWQNDENGSPLSVSFLDKRFQIRFEVPPFVLSNWSEYLHSLLESAFPDHDEAEFHTTYRVYDQYRENTGESPTPRDLKLFVNQLGAIHRQWNDKFPLPQIAFYVLLRRGENKNIDVSLLNDNIKKLTPEVLMGQDVYVNLAALYYNVEPEIARQLLLRQPLSDALRKGNIEEVKSLSEWRGFVQVLENIPFGDWTNGTSYQLANAAFALEKSGVLEKIGFAETFVLKSQLRNVFNTVGSWGIFNQDTAPKIVSLLQMLGIDSNKVRKAFDAVSTQEISGKEGDSLSTAVHTWVDGFLNLVVELDKVASYNVLDHKGEIRLSTSSEGFLEGCAYLHEQDQEGKYWALIFPSISTDEVAKKLGELSKTDKLTGRYLGAIRVMKEGKYKIDWGDCITEIGNRFRTPGQYSSEIVSTQLSILWELKSEDDKLDQLIKQLA